MIFLLVLPLALAAVPADDTELHYTLRRVVTGTGGSYEGWSEQLESDGHYVLDVEDDAIVVHARYAWRYGATDGKHDRGEEHRDVRVDTRTRGYRGRTDLDDYDDVRGALTTWLWIPPDVQPGDRVQILDHVYTIRARDRRWASTAKASILAEATGTDHRDDVYGRFDYRWEDSFWFDPATGMVLAERYEEHDEGTSNGEPATFRWVEWLDVTSATYVVGRGEASAPPGFGPFVSASSPKAAPGGGPSALGLAVLGMSIVGLGSLVIGSATRHGAQGSADRFRSPQFGEVQVRELERGARIASVAQDQLATTSFAPWIEDLIARTWAGGGRVVVATGASGRCVGLGLREGFAPVGTILSPCAMTVEAIRAKLGVPSFFSDHEHRVGDVRSYNVHERLVVLRVRVPAVRAWDRELVQPLEPTDLDAVVALTSAVFHEATRPWIEASLAAGDVGLVARRDGVVVGFGLAAVAGRHGRLHGLAVAPEHRNQGIGSELIRARLAALTDLGVDEASVEIGADHAASLHLARKHGFEPVGALVVETIESDASAQAWRRA